jgi:hypothetical protein
MKPPRVLYFLWRLFVIWSWINTNRFGVTENLALKLLQAKLLFGYINNKTLKGGNKGKQGNFNRLGSSYCWPGATSNATIPEVY